MKCPTDTVVARPQLVDQAWPWPKVCAECAQPIPANTQYKRLTWELDGADPNGRDLHVRCAKAKGTK